MAHAAKMMAEAEAVGEAERASMIKFGAELRAGLERDMLEFQKSREELLTRLQIARGKNESVKYQAMLQTLGKRLDTEAFERVEEKKAMAQVQTARRSKIFRR